MIKGFKEFLFRGNVIDLAVAVVIGAAFTGVVDALVKGILTPLISAIVGKPSFDGLAVVLPVKHLMELQMRRRAAGDPVDAANPISDEVLLLTEIRDALRARQ